MGNGMIGNEWFRFMAGCLLTGLILLPTACSVRKQQEKSVRRQVESFRLHTDSLSFIRGRQTECEDIRLYEMIRLSPPDSAGRQYVSAVVHSRTARNRRSYTQDSLKRNSAGATKLKKENHSAEITEKRRDPLSICKWSAGIIAVIGGIVIARRRSVRPA